MEHKKDIGDLLRDRLDAAQKAPKQTLWERLDNSLEEREKKRRRALWFWYGGAGFLLALLLLGGLFMASNLDKIATEENTGEMDTKIKIEAEIDTEKEFKTSRTNTTVAQDETVLKTANETNLDGTNKIETTGENATTKTSTNNLTTKKGYNTTKDVINEGGFVVTTTHEYYNSDLDSTTRSQNKQHIDSLVATNKRVMAIKDSIARKRATDSIKVNEASKDSIPE